MKRPLAIPFSLLMRRSINGGGRGHTRRRRNFIGRDASPSSEIAPRSDVSILGLNFPPESSGIAPYTGALATGLQGLGYRVSAHVAHPHYPEWSIHDGYGQWTRTEWINGVAVCRRLHYVPQAPHGMRRLVSELSFGARLIMARWGEPQVVVAVSPSLFSTALVALRMRLAQRRVPLIVWVQDIYTLGMAETGEGGGLAGRVIRWVEAHTLRSAERVVVIHQRFADYAVAEFKVDESNIEVVRNWAHLPPVEPIDPTAAKSALGWPSGVTLAVHTGNMGVKQGLENVVDAARVADDRCAPVHFVLVGDGSERRRLLDRARGITRLTFVDPLDSDDYRLALSAADILLVNEMPGVSAMAVPSKLTSYFDAGRPVIAATDRDGITASEVAASGAGLVVTAGEPHALLDAVLTLSTDVDAVARFGFNGRRYRAAVLDERVAIKQWASVVDMFVSDYSPSKSASPGSG